MTKEKAELTEIDREHLSKLIKDGGIEGSFFRELKNGKSKYINWSLKTKVWMDD